jgi:type VI secretion system ImpA family protein
MSLIERVPVLIKERPKSVDELLLAPIPGSRPTGHDVRYNGDYDVITEARRQDNAALPQGVWLRELKRADWVSVERICVDILATRSKDLHVACWLTEAWMNMQGFAGLARGLALLGKLCERFWHDLYPAIEDGDLSARVAPLEWLNEKLPDLLRSLTIVRSTTDPEKQLSWTDFVNAQRLETIRQRDKRSAERAEAAGSVTLACFEACRQRTDTAMLDSTQSELQQARCALDFLNSLLEEHCGKDAPGLGSIRCAIEEILAFVSVELTDRRKPAWLASLLRNRAPSATAAIPNVSGPEAIATEHSMHTREQAYQELLKIAEFLLRTEPHSPTPYLIQRAASWGEMPLPALVEQLSDSGSNMVRLLDVLGLLKTCVEFDQNDSHQ